LSNLQGLVGRDSIKYLNKIDRLINAELTVNLREQCSCVNECSPVCVCAYQELKPSLSISTVFYLFENYKPGCNVMRTMCLSIRVLIWQSRSIKRKTCLKPRERQANTADGNDGSHKCEGRRGALPPLYFDKASALALSITVKFFPPQFVCCARAPDGRLEVPCSPIMRILFASLST
jgi:hypothetical protein